MNLILFEESELARPLPQGDERARPILEILRCQEGDEFDVGLVDGPRGKAVLLQVQSFQGHFVPPKRFPS